MHVLSPVPTAECPLCVFVRTCDLPPESFLRLLQARFGPCAVCGETITVHAAFHPHDREGTCGGFVGTIVEEIL
jgi:hypothetical protein